MNQLETQSVVRRNRQLFRQGTPLNYCKFIKGNSARHEWTKSAICYLLTLRDEPYYCEAFFDGGKADVVCLGKGLILEVTESEKPESIEEKRKVYPLPIFAIPASIGHDSLRRKLEDVLG